MMRFPLTYRFRLLVGFATGLALSGCGSGSGGTGTETGGTNGGGGASGHGGTVGTGGAAGNAGGAIGAAGPVGGPAVVAASALQGQAAPPLAEARLLVPAAPQLPEARLLVPAASPEWAEVPRAGMVRQEPRAPRAAETACSIPARNATTTTGLAATAARRSARSRTAGFARPSARLPAHRHLRRRPARADRGLRRQQHWVRRRLFHQLFGGRGRLALSRSGKALRSDLRRRRHRRQREVR